MPKTARKADDTREWRALMERGIEVVQNEVIDARREAERRRSDLQARLESRLDRLERELGPMLEALKNARDQAIACYRAENDPYYDYE